MVRSLPKSSLHCSIVDSYVFENFILADEPFAKSWWILGTCVSVNNLCGKLASYFESPIKFQIYESYKVTWVPFFIPDFNFSSCKLDNFTFKVLYWVIVYWYYIKWK